MVAKLMRRHESIAVVSAVVLFVLFWGLLGASWPRDVPSLLRDVAWLGIVAAGEALVIVSGELDLSVGSVYAFVSMIFVVLLEAGVDPAVALIIALVLGAVIGLINGALTWKFKLPSLLVTLGSLFLYRGLVEYVTNGFPVSIPDVERSDFLLQILGGKTFGFSNSIYFCAIIVALFSLILAKGRFGNHLYAVGGDVQAATATGVPSGWVKIRAFMLCSMLAGLAGVLTACTLSSVSTTTGTAMEFEAIAATVIGGVSLMGGAGTVWGAVLGVFTLLALKHGLILQGINIFAYQLALGIVLVGLLAIKGVFPRVFAPQ